ncbi:MAG: hypothetical protein ACNA7J_14025 [Wenzhouxiangella sp.]
MPSVQWYLLFPAHKNQASANQTIITTLMTTLATLPTFLAVRP